MQHAVYAANAHDLPQHLVEPQTHYGVTTEEDNGGILLPAGETRGRYSLREVLFGEQLPMAYETVQWRAYNSAWVKFFQDLEEEAAERRHDDDPEVTARRDAERKRVSVSNVEREAKLDSLQQALDHYRVKQGRALMRLHQLQGQKASWDEKVIEKARNDQAAAAIRNLQQELITYRRETADRPQEYVDPCPYVRQEVPDGERTAIYLMLNLAAKAKSRPGDIAESLLLPMQLDFVQQTMRDKFTSFLSSNKDPNCDLGAEIAVSEYLKGLGHDWPVLMELLGRRRRANFSVAGRAWYALASWWDESTGQAASTDHENSRRWWLSKLSVQAPPEFRGDPLWDLSKNAVARSMLVYASKWIQVAGSRHKDMEVALRVQLQTTFCKYVTGGVVFDDLVHEVARTSMRTFAARATGF